MRLAGDDVHVGAAVDSFLAQCIEIVLTELGGSCTASQVRPSLWALYRSSAEHALSYHVFDYNRCAKQK